MRGNGESMDTVAVHDGERRPGPDGSVVFPIYQGTVYEVEPGTSYHDLKYIRLNSTPSQNYLHDELAAIEGAEAAIATSSGMAAGSGLVLRLRGRRAAGDLGSRAHRADQGLPRRDDHQPAAAGRAA